MSLAAPRGRAAAGAIVVRGFLINILNPKLSIFFLAFLPEWAMGLGKEVLRRMRENPAADWRTNDVEVVCREFGLTCRPPKRGRHYRISYPGVPQRLVIPGRRTLKAVYVRRFVAMVTAILERSAASGLGKN